MTVSSRFTRLFTLTLSLIIAALAGISLYAALALERSLIPQLDQKMLTMGLTVNAKLDRALRYGIPLERLPGVADFFGTVLAADPDLAYLVLTRRDGTVLHQYGTSLPKPEQLADATAATLKMLPASQGAASADPAKEPWPIQALTARPLGDFYNLALPVGSGEAVAGVLHIGADANFVMQKIQEILFDIATVFVIATLVAFELLLLIVHHYLITPINRLEMVLSHIADGNLSHILPVSRDETGWLARLLNQLVERLNAAHQQILRQAASLQSATPAAVNRLSASLEQLWRGFTLAPKGRPAPYQLADLFGARVATFLFIFAVELSQSFLPLYARAYATDLSGSPTPLLISLPLTVFTLTAALSMPLAGWRFERAGSSRTFTEGALLMTLGLAGTGLAWGFYDLLAWRMLTAAGYAFMYVACQSYVVAHAPPQKQASSGALFVSGLMAATICGPAIGGILADHIGYTATFGCAAILAACAGLMAFRLLSAEPVPASPPRRPVRGGVVRAITGNGRFMLLMLFAAIPAKLLLNGFLFFLVPLTLSEFGGSRSEIGRIAMLYGLAALFLGPVFARLADRFALHGLLVGAGGLLAGIGLIPVFFFPATTGVLAGVLLLGIGQAMSISSQLALVTRIGRASIEQFGQGPVLGSYRLIERLGGASGPLVAAGLAAVFGYPGAITITGLLGVVTATLFSVSFLILGIEPEPDDELSPIAS
ncbi:MAG TPA: MFS transporter [Candidatus Competibacteraceae bacterium]|nr:MFS transporter [Candidatus Competibacteraceae bacterium]MCP5132450.1 MFS transporter [Gammaproteobacteria bacterium]HPF59768.1 MFS transporter [Candidatus Competibacteraceae bacterium]HRY18492.1 MFS transporter [Candidatus Competibacteraceae bacterium]